MARIGELIEGKYEVLSLIGEGGMSRVYLVRDQRLNKLWAVKEIGRTAKDANNTVVVQSLIAEANLMKRLDHPALPRIVDIIQTEQTIYVVMDYVEGESLNKVLRRVGHAMPQEDVIDWGIQLCDALGYLHSRKPSIIYRDMKPGNIMLNDEGTVKLIDFGIAREYKEDRTSDTMILGTRGYAAPEQFSRTAQTDARTDIYSLGVTLHHLVTGRAPSEDTVLRPIREINPQLSEGLEYIITKATQADPARRYQSCAEMSYDLEHYDQLTAGYRREQKKKLRTFNALWIGAIVCAVLGAACIGGSFYMKNSTYESYLTKAKAASVDGSDSAESAAETACLQAIETSPSQIEPYSYLVNSVYKANANFSMVEAGRWESLYSEHVNDIDDNADYAQLCYDVGLLYYLYYEQDSDADYSTSGITQAAEWFERAIESYETGASDLSTADYAAAQIYVTIGEFYSTLSQSVLEGSEGELYAEFWEALENAMELVSSSELYDEEDDDDLAIIVKLRLYEIIYSVIASNTYLSGLSSAGITSDEAATMLQDVVEATAELADEAQSSTKAAEICEKVLDGIDVDDVAGTIEDTDAYQTIETVYGSVGSRLSSLSGQSGSTSVSGTSSASGVEDATEGADE